MDNPLISVVIPVYNCEKYITNALDSVFRQNYPNLEVIVINDGSTDNSLEVVEKYEQNIKIISQENQGPAVARNAGIKVATGEIVAFIDSDDLWTDSHIHLMLPYMMENMDYHLVRGHTQFIRTKDNKITEISDKIFMPSLIGAGLFRASIFDKIGLFDESMYHGEDADWVTRFDSSKYKERRIDETTLLYHRHDNNMTNKREEFKKGMFDAIRKSIQRK